MAEISPKTVRDWQEAELSPTVGIEYEGGIGLLEENQYPNQFLIEIGALGEPTNTQIAVPPKIVGRNIYFSERVADTAQPNPNTLTRQNGAALPIDNPSWVASQPIVEKALKLPTGSRIAEGLPPADIPTWDLVPEDKKGFKQGYYGYMFDCRTQDGLRTTTSGMTIVAVGQNQALRFQIPDGLTEGTTHIGIYLTRPALTEDEVDVESARLQKVQNLKNLKLRRFDLTGPWRAGEKPADKNETYLGILKQPRKRHYRKVNSRRDLAYGWYRFATQPVSRFGFGVLSLVSDYEQIEAKEIGGGQKDDNDKEKNSDEMDDKDAKSESKIIGEKNKAFRLKPSEWVKGMREWVPWVQKNGSWYKVYNLRSREGSEDAIRRGGSNTPVEINGNTSEDTYSSTDTTEIDVDDINRRPERWVMVQVEPPSTDETGIESPDPYAEPAAPAPFGAVLPLPGKYLVRVTDVTEDGLESPPSPPVKITLTANMMMRVIFGNDVNLIVNSEGGERDSDDIPTHWSISIPGSSTYRWSDGRHILEALSPGITSGNASPYVRSENYIAIDPEGTYRFKGTLAVTGRTGGTAAIQIMEFTDESSTAINTINVQTAAENGKISWDKTYTAADWNDSTQRIKINITMTSSAVTRLMTMQVYDMVFTSGTVIPDKVIKTPEYSYTADDFAAPAYTPFPSQAFFAVGAPKPPPGYEPTTVEPLEQRYFDSQSLPGTGWTQESNNATIQISSTTPIEGSQSLRVVHSNKNLKGYAYIERDFDGDMAGPHLSQRFTFKVKTFPKSGYIDISGIFYNGKRSTIRVHSSRKFSVGMESKQGNWKWTYPSTLLTANVVYDIEHKVLGGASVDGTTQLWFATRGGTRSLIGYVSDVDLSGADNVPRKARIGVVAADSHASNTYELFFDEYVATTTGDIANRDDATPIGPVPDPDRPKYADGVEYRESEPVNPSGGDPRESNQIVYFLPPGTEPSDDYGPRVGWDEFYSDPIPVKPGQLYTFALYGRFERDAGSEPARPWHVTLYRSDGTFVEKGSPYDSMTGGGITESRGWAEDVMTFTVDEGCTEMRITSKSMGPGYYKWQDPLLTEDAYASQAQRDDRRGYNRATVGEATIRLNAHLQQANANPYQVTLEEDWLSWGAAASSVDEGASWDAEFRSHPSDTPEISPEPWSPWHDVAGDVPVGNTLEIKLYLWGTGMNTPFFTDRSVYLRTKPFIANAVKADRSRIPGGAMVKGLEIPPTRPDWEVVRVGGTTYATDLTGPVMVLPEFELRVFSAEGRKFFEELAPDEEFMIEAPNLAQDGTGLMLTVRPAQVLTFEREHQYEIRDGIRWSYAKVTIEAAEVVEVSRLV